MTAHLATSSPPISNQQLADKITLLAGQINAANYQFLKLIAQFDQREAWSGEGIRSCAHWLNWTCGITIGAAREKVRVARCLESLPKINQAFAQGVISYSKVRAMTRVATNDNEDYLLMIAKHGTASHVEQLVKKYQRVQNIENTSEQAKQPDSKKDPLFDAREMVSYQDDDGMWHIHAKLPPEAGALVVKAIDAILFQEKSLQEKVLQDKAAQEQEEQAHQNNDKNISAETLSADTFETASDVTDATADKTTEIPPEITDQTTQVTNKTINKTINGASTEAELHQTLSFPQRRVDALSVMAEHYLATVSNDEGIKTLAGHERCQVMLHVDINTLQSHNHSHANKHCNLDNKRWLSPETAKRLACDASLVTVLEDDKGKVLNIGRRSRTIPPAIQRALSLRDSSCKYPGCCSTNYLDAHHIKHWADGGETKLDNLLMLCRHHHRALHAGEFHIKVEQSTLVFTTAKGKRIQQSFFPQFPKQTTTDNIGQQWPLNSPFINKDTTIPLWQGERMDYGMGIDGLLRRKRR